LPDTGGLYRHREGTQSAKGRGFLSDGLMRNRNAETEPLLEAVAAAPPWKDRRRAPARAAEGRLAEPAQMARTRRELAAMMGEEDAVPAGKRAGKLEAALSHVESGVMAMLDMWDYPPEPDEPEQAPLPPALQAALRKGLIEELNFAMLSGAQKAALFN
jgi:hypothetical protein